MLITITCTGNLCLQHLYKKNELVLHVTFTAFVVDIQCSISWTFQLFYIYFFYLVSLLDCSLAPSTLISYPCWCLFSLKPSSLARALQLIFTETHWLHWWSRAALQKYPPPEPHPPILYVWKWACLRERATARINAQISTISLQLHVCQTTCCKGITRCLLDAARRWQLPHHLIFSFRVRNQMAAS